MKNKDTNIYLQPTVGTVFLNSLFTNCSARLDFPTPEPPSSTILTLRVWTGLPHVSFRGWVPTGPLCVFISIKWKSDSMHNCTFQKMKIKAKSSLDMFWVGNIPHFLVNKPVIKRPAN